MSLRLVISLVLCGVCAFAQKKPVTLDVMNAQRAFAELTWMEWAPEGKRFAWIDGGRVKLYDVAARTEKVVVELKPLEGAAVATVAPDAFEWQNRRVKEKSLQWSGDGARLLLKVKGDLFLIEVAN